MKINNFRGELTDNPAKKKHRCTGELLTQPTNALGVPKPVCYTGDSLYWGLPDQTRHYREYTNRCFTEGFVIWKVIVSKLTCAWLDPRNLKNEEINTWHLKSPYVAHTLWLSGLEVIFFYRCISLYRTPIYRNFDLSAVLSGTAPERCFYTLYTGNSDDSIHALSDRFRT